MRSCYASITADPAAEMLLPTRERHGGWLQEGEEGCFITITVSSAGTYEICHNSSFCSGLFPASVTGLTKGKVESLFLTQY